MPSWAAARGARPLLVRVAAALPGHQRAAVDEQGCGVLGEDGQRGQGAGRHHVVGLAAGAARQVLGAFRHRNRVRQPRCCGQAVDHLALPARRLDQVDTGRGQRHRQREPREARPGAYIGDPPGAYDVVEVQRGEAVGQMHARRISGRCDGGGRVDLGRECVEQARELIDLIVRKRSAYAGQLPRFP